MTRSRKTAKTNPADLDPALVQAYRSTAPFRIADAVQGLEIFLHHRAQFLALGHRQLVAATERAFWQDAVLLAGHPAASLREAELKIQALRPALDGRAWTITDDGLRCLAAMITVAVESERTRWRLPKAMRH